MADITAEHSVGNYESIHFPPLQTAPDQEQLYIKDSPALAHLGFLVCTAGTQVWVHLIPCLHLYICS